LGGMIQAMADDSLTVCGMPASHIRTVASSAVS
jgi:hypothetical protein